MRLMVIGNSHAAMFWTAACASAQRDAQIRPITRRALVSPGDPFEWSILGIDEAEALPISDQQDECNWRGDFDAVVSRIAAPAAEVDHVLVVWRGFQVDALALVVIGQMFDFLEQPDDRIAHGAAVVPLTMVTEALEQTLDVEQFVLLLQALPQLRATVLVPPPPLPGDEVRTRLTTAHDSWFKGRAEAAGYDMESVPLVPDPVRAKTWRVFARCYAKVAEASGVGFLMPPADAFAESGLRDQRFWGDDMIHANAAYATRCIEALLGEKAERSETAAHRG
jgi:hypothetical protein